MRIKIETLSHRNIDSLDPLSRGHERSDSEARQGVPTAKCLNDPMAKWCNPKKGFTLLEVMIAMAIMVLAIATIIPLFAVGSALAVSHA